MKHFGLIVCSLCLLVTSASAWAIDDEEEELVEKTFRPAIVKIDVSSRNPVFKEIDVVRNGITKKETVNICLSEGTGFVISARHVATATHVYDIDAECGEPTIVVKSTPHKLQRLASPVGAKDDIAVLEVTKPFPRDMCAIAIKPDEVFGARAIRFGIPGGFEEPPPAFKMKIGQKQKQFDPLIMMTPTAVEKGESGGPVIYRYNVVGVTHAKHKTYTAYSFMTVGSALRSIMTEKNLLVTGRVCSPVEADLIYSVPPRPGDVGDIMSGALGGLLGRLDRDNSKTLSDMFAHRNVIGRLSTSKIKTLGPETLAQVMGGKHANVVVTTDLGLTEITVERASTSKDAAKSNEEVRKTWMEIRLRAEEKLWDQYVTAAEKKGLWKDADTPIPNTASDDQGAAPPAENSQQ